jgi:hypothetical protein
VPPHLFLRSPAAPQPSKQADSVQPAGPATSPPRSPFGLSCSAPGRDSTGVRRPYASASVSRPPRTPAPHPLISRTRALARASPCSRRRPWSRAAAAVPFPDSSSSPPPGASRCHQELQDVGPHLPCRSPSSEDRRSAAAPCRSGRPPWSYAVDLFQAVSLRFLRR